MDSPKYPAELIKQIAEDVDMGMICFLNPDTREVESVLGESYIAHWVNDFQDIYDKVDGWNNFVRIDPPESWQSFAIMEDFIGSCIPDGDPVKHRLSETLSRRHPFRNFKFIIDDSRYRQQWFDYKQSRIEEFVREQIIPSDDNE